MKILAATDFSTRSNRALRQAGFLAQPAGARLYIVHVVDDDRPANFVGMEQREADAVLTEQIASMPELLGVECHPLVLAGDPFDGILRTAAEINPDVIVMGAHRKQFLLDIFTGTTIERVIRRGSFPVLMVNNEAQHKYRKVIVPVDFSETSANAIRTARSTGLLTDEGGTLLHAFASMAKGKMYVAGLKRESIENYVADERQRATKELAEFMRAHGLNEREWSIRVNEGGPIEVISGAVSEIHPDLLVMGTRGRTGFVKAMIGSVTEEALRSLSVDILAVPPAK